MQLLSLLLKIKPLLRRFPKRRLASWTLLVCICALVASSSLNPELGRSLQASLLDLWMAASGPSGSDTVTGHPPP